MLATTTRTSVIQRFLVDGTLWATQEPKRGFAGARIEITLNVVVTIRTRRDTDPEVSRAQALVAAAWEVAPDCDEWEWEGHPLVTPLQGGAR
jgi:hypothetical protein